MSEDSESSHTDSTGMSTSSEHSRSRKRKSNVSLSNSNEELLKRIKELEKIVNQGIGTPCKTAKVANDKTPIKNTPKNYAKSARSSMAQCKSSSDSNNASESTDLLEYDCKLCEGTFKSKQARNSHYTGTHKVENEKLLFFPDGTGLVESTLEHHLRLKPDYLKTAARNMSSRICRLCKVELDMEDLKWHYEREHRVIQMRKVIPLICLNNSDIKIIAEPFRCEYCPRTFDDESRLKMHLLSHTAKGDEMKCKFCKLNFNTKLYNAHVKKEHPEMYLKRIGTNGGNTNKSVYRNKSRRQKVAILEKCKKSQIKFSCRFCAFKCSSPVTLRHHRQSVHKGKERLNAINKKTMKCQNNNVSAAEFENNKKKASEVNSTSEHESGHITISTQAIMMYLCEACDLATTSYDEAVSHSQDHILNIVNDETMLCEHCNLKFCSDYETHKQLHMIHSELDIDSFQCTTYDHKLLFTDKWFDMFDFLPKVKVKIIAGDHSVYFSTRCIRFKLPGCMNNSSAPFFLYQCVTCRNYVDPYSIESHVQQQSCSIESKSHPCEVCQRPFYSDIARIQHSDTHKVPDADSKYRTILFNDQSDLTTNELLLTVANKNVPKKKNKVIATGNIATRLEENNQIEGSQDADKAKENNDPCEHEKLATVYKCRCGLCFHTLPHLYEHLQKCSSTLKVDRETCKCGLVFDSQHYSLHCKVHCGYTTIVVKEIIIKPVEKIDIRGMVEVFKNNVLPPVLVNKLTTENYVKPSNVMVDDNKCSQEPTIEKDKVECISDTQHNIKEKLANLKCLRQEGHNESPPNIGTGTENPKKLIKMQSQNISEIKVLPNDSDTSAEKPQNSKVISNDDLKKVISMYNFIKDVMKNKSITVTEPQTAMEVTEDNDSNNTPDDSVWTNYARNKEENRSLVATTIEVEVRNRRASIVESNAKENTSVNISETGVNTELEDEVAKEKHDQTGTQDVDDPNLKRNSQRRGENEVGRNFKNNSIVNDIKSESVESKMTEYNEEELLKDYDEEDYTLCPDIVDLLTDDED